MIRVLLDVNVILDVLLDRRAHAEASSAVWSAVERGITEGMLAAHSVRTIHYLTRKATGDAKAKRMLSSILQVFAVAAVDGPVIEEALHSTCADFEDAVVAAAARRAGCDYIVTRDPKGFRGSAVRAFAPEGVMPLLR